MSNFVLKKLGIYQFLYTLCILLLLIYLALNVTEPGDGGAALPLLVGFVSITCILILVQILQSFLHTRIHWVFIIFLGLIGWLSLRITLDLHDTYQLKQVVVGTTGGVFLFFLLGNLSKRGLDSITTYWRSYVGAKLIVILFFILSYLIHSELSQRSMRLDVFLIEDIDGNYQRAGNFIIIMFLMVSYLVIKIMSYHNIKKHFEWLLWLSVYTIGFIFFLISSQRLGSNGAAFNLVVVYFLTIVVSILALNSRLRQDFLQSKPLLLLSRRWLKLFFLVTICSCAILVIAGATLIYVSGFDIYTTRAFGFGDGGNSSIESRFKILMDTGLAQIGYSPLFGNVDVARLTTGDAGETLHNFFPNIFAELGVIGLAIVVSLFYMVFKEILKGIHNTNFTSSGFQKSIIHIWLFYIFLFLIFYANIAVGKSWIVMWFFVGLSVNVFVFNKKTSVSAKQRELTI